MDDVHITGNYTFLHCIFLMQIVLRLFLWLFAPFFFICCYSIPVLFLDSTYTVEEAVEKLGFGSFQLLVTLFSGFLWVSK